MASRPVLLSSLLLALPFLVHSLHTMSQQTLSSQRRLLRSSLTIRRRFRQLLPPRALPQASAPVFPVALPVPIPSRSWMEVSRPFLTLQPRILAQDHRQVPRLCPTQAHSLTWWIPQNCVLSQLWRSLSSVLPLGSFSTRCNSIPHLPRTFSSSLLLRTTRYQPPCVPLNPCRLALSSLYRRTLGVVNHWTSNQPPRFSVLLPCFVRIFTQRFLFRFPSSSLIGSAWLATVSCFCISLSSAHNAYARSCPTPDAHAL